MKIEFEGRKVLEVELTKDTVELLIKGEEWRNLGVFYDDFLNYMLENDTLKVLKFELGEKQIIIAGIFNG